MNYQIYQIECQMEGRTEYRNIYIYNIYIYQIECQKITRDEMSDRDNRRQYVRTYCRRINMTYVLLYVRILATGRLICFFFLLEYKATQTQSKSGPQVSEAAMASVKRGQACLVVCQTNGEARVDDGNA